MKKFIFLLLPSFILLLHSGCSNKKQLAQRWPLLPFTKADEVNPILSAGYGVFKCPIIGSYVNWEEKDVFNPTAVVRNDTVFLLYRAEDVIGKFAGTSRIGLAYSVDGLHFIRKPKPVLFPANDSMKVFEWEGGIEDPRIIEDGNGNYFLTYTAYDGTTARLCMASSPDLTNWTKHGLVLKGKYKNAWSKSGAIVGKQIGTKIIAQKINGHYWMYFGDTNLFMATSDDLVNWTPVEENGALKPVLRPRKNYFDSRLVESGPAALITADGIRLLYNGMNLPKDGDTTIAEGAYCAGQALFDRNDPTRLIDRLEHTFLQPDKSYEISGQVNQLCFIEGMVPFKGNWFLYFGTADSKIAVATSPLLNR
jgi:predicted GH43/DUF377 family glycosyl hydrolase